MSRSIVRPTGKTAYLSVIATCGAFVLVKSVYDVLLSPPGVEWFTLAALTLITASFTVKVPSLAARLSVSEAFIIASGLLFGPAAGSLTVTLDALVMSFWLNRGTRSPARVIFNTSAPAVAFWFASTLFFWLSGTAPGPIQRPQLPTTLPPLFVFTTVYFLVNAWLVVFAVVSDKGGSPLAIWRSHFAAFGINYFVGASLAVLLVTYGPRIDFTLLSVIVPLLLVSYATFRSSIGRLEDATRHVSQMNEMYLATIEALALAVDAKDQITHGHIRRVQICTVELAKCLGVTDPGQLQAIEAAALLHDMGKLAVPEHILNKPGKLSAAEFDKMKTHAEIGADMLSSIKFPYPVVPVVRHHHENWDGSGYPNGISGVDIPLGARILSVVDCFDALTSDRPYRPALTPSQAFEILRERRGTFYDPLIVDTFIARFEQIASKMSAAVVDVPPQFVAALGLDRTATDTHSATEDVERTQRLCHEVATAKTLQEAFDQVARHLRTVTPATVCIFFTYEPRIDRLVGRFVSGDVGGRLGDLEIDLGDRVSGWSAATGVVSRNAHATLDLREAAAACTPPVRGAMAVPLNNSSGLVGVLTLYAPRTDAFSQQQEAVTARLGQSLTVVCGRDNPTGLIREAAVNS